MARLAYLPIKREQVQDGMVLFNKQSHQEVPGIVAHMPKTPKFKLTYPEGDSETVGIRQLLQLCVIDDIGEVTPIKNSRIPKAQAIIEKHGFDYEVNFKTVSVPTELGDIIVAKV